MMKNEIQGKEHEQLQSVKTALYLEPESDGISLLVPNISSGILQSLLQVMIGAERYCQSNKMQLPWEMDDNLKKHRDADGHDLTIQVFLAHYMRNYGVQTNVIMCGKSGGYYITEMVDDSEHIIHVKQTLDEKRDYMKEYLKRNRDANNPLFFCLKYKWDTKKQKIGKLDLYAPSESEPKRLYASSNELLSALNLIRRKSANIDVFKA